METFTGQFQQVITRSKRGRPNSRGDSKLAVVNVIAGGKVVENYVELFPPSDMWKLGIITMGAWLAWEGKAPDDDPANLRLSEAPDDADAIIARGTVYVRQPGDFSVGDMFQRGYAPPVQDDGYTQPARGCDDVSAMFLKSQSR